MVGPEPSTKNSGHPRLDKNNPLAEEWVRRRCLKEKLENSKKTGSKKRGKVGITLGIGPSYLYAKKKTNYKYKGGGEGERVVLIIEPSKGNKMRGRGGDFEKGPIRRG